MDIKCVVCGEPWDSYGVNHGDMLSWEAKLFKSGAGCPSCEGESNGFVPSTLADTENGDEDPMDRILARDAHERGKAPKWERPEDPKHWECEGCGVQVRTDLDTNEIVYQCPFKSVAWYNAYQYERNGTPEKEPAHTFDGDTHVCEFCLERCYKCDAPLSRAVTGDCYEDGYIWTVSGDYDRCYCSDCHTEAEQEAALDAWRNCYSTAERLEYICRRWGHGEFERCQARWEHTDDGKRWAWRTLLANVRGQAFDGYASELLG
jgi:hypothetical protein